MTIDKKKLVNLLESGAEIEFSYNGKLYTILAWTENGISFGEQNSNDDIVYSDCNDFILNCKIGSVSIIDALPKIEILYHS